MVSVALPKSPTNLAQGDEVPQIITRITRQLPSEKVASPAKRLLQHNPLKSRLSCSRPEPPLTATQSGYCVVRRSFPLWQSLSSGADFLRDRIRFEQ
jgi:hypothetical protein